MRREVGRGDRALHVAIPSTYKTLIVASWREKDDDNHDGQLSHVSGHPKYHFGQ
jgi:transcription termination factor Rho